MLTDPLTLLTLALAAAWACGLNAYAAVFILGFMSTRGVVDLPAQLALLEHPVLLAAVATLYFVECFADKVPGVMSGWDAIHTFIRIPIGALLSAAAVSDLGWATQAAAGLVGGGIAAASHAAKASARVVINTPPRLTLSWGVSASEDALAFLGPWLALTHPLGFAVLFTAWLLLLIRYWPALKYGGRTAFGWLARTDR